MRLLGHEGPAPAPGTSTERPNEQHDEEEQEHEARALLVESVPALTATLGRAHRLPASTQRGRRRG